MKVTKELIEQAKRLEESWERGFYSSRGYHSRNGETKACFAKVKNSNRIFCFFASCRKSIESMPDVEEIKTLSEILGK